jgi:hypothetical protein
MFKTILTFIKERLKEGSTWVAATILVALGLEGPVAQEVIDLIVQVLAVLLAVLPDREESDTAPDGDISG